MTNELNSNQHNNQTVTCTKCGKTMKLYSEMYVANWDFFPKGAEEPDPIEPFKTTYYHKKCTPYQLTERRNG